MSNDELVVEIVANCANNIVNQCLAASEAQKTLQSVLNNALEEKSRSELNGLIWEKDAFNMTDSAFKHNFRMEPAAFEMLVQELLDTEREDRNFRNGMPLRKRVAIAIYTLGSSAEYHVVARLFEVSENSVCLICKEFCSLVWRKLAPKYLGNNFLTQTKVEECVKGFEATGFPQCFGAIGGCHIKTKPKPSESTVLLALVDHKYRFMYINVGSPGHCNDSDIYEKSLLKPYIETSELFEANARKIGGIKVPVILIGDSSFKISTRIMKPYSVSVTGNLKQMVFNYHIAKTRRVAEDAFRHLKARFGRIGEGLDSRHDNTNAIIKCCCVLHNFLIEHNNTFEDDCDENVGPQSDQAESKTNLHNQKSKAEAIRSALADILCASEKKK